MSHVDMLFVVMLAFVRNTHEAPQIFTKHRSAHTLLSQPKVYKSVYTTTLQINRFQILHLRHCGAALFHHDSTWAAGHGDPS